MRHWLNKYKFWLIWTPLTILWMCASFAIVSIYGNSTRGLAFLLASPLVIVGLYFASKRTIALESQNKIDSKRLLSESFAKSIELLGNKAAAVRQGAIYALGKIAEDNDREREVITNALCGFIREKQSIPDEYRETEGKLYNFNALIKDINKINNKENEAEKVINPLAFFKELSIDVEAAVKVLTKISRILNKEHKPNQPYKRKKYNLSNIYLIYANFSNANLSNFDLSDSMFDNCIFEGVKFYDSSLIGSNFKGSSFKDDAEPDRKAEFDKETEIMKADFSATVGLTKEMLSECKRDETKFPQASKD